MYFYSRMQILPHERGLSYHHAKSHAFITFWAIPPKICTNRLDYYGNNYIYSMIFIDAILLTLHYVPDICVKTHYHFFFICKKYPMARYTSNLIGSANVNWFSYYWYTSTTLRWQCFIKWTKYLYYLMFRLIFMYSWNWKL